MPKHQHSEAVAETVEEFTSDTTLEHTSASGGEVPKEVAALVEAIKQYDTEELDKLTTTSGKIRYLTAAGLTKGQITKILKYKDGRPILYQHVYNVLKKPLKRQG